MKITYDVPCPLKDWVSKNKENILAESYGKFKKEYDEIFHFVHSKEKELVLTVDNPKSFYCSVRKAMNKIYPQFIISQGENEVRITKTW